MEAGADQRNLSIAQQGEREIGHAAVWSLSSAKLANGVEQLRDGDVATYWQSDGQQPHLINIQFHRKMRVSAVAMYTDVKLDESYTPVRVGLRMGNAFNCLHDCGVFDLHEPVGWNRFDTPSADGLHKYTRAFFIQLVILRCHQHGRDTHVRQVVVLGPRGEEDEEAIGGPFSTVEFSSFASVR